MERKTLYWIIMEIGFLILGLICLVRSFYFLVFGNDDASLLFLGACVGFLALSKVYDLQLELYKQGLHIKLVSKCDEALETLEKWKRGLKTKPSKPI